MDGKLGFVIVVYHCFTASNVAAEWCSSFYRYCYTGCCLYDCCLKDYTTTRRLPDWTTTLTKTTSSATSNESVIAIGIPLVVSFLIIASVCVCVYLYRRPDRPTPVLSQNVAAPMSTLRVNPLYYETPVGVNNPEWFIPPDDSEQDTPYTVTTPQQQNSYPVNSLASPAYSNTSSNNNFNNVLPQNQPLTSQRAQYSNTNMTQDAPPPYTDRNIVPPVNALAQNQPMTLQQTSYLNTNISQDAPPPYTDRNIVPPVNALAQNQPMTLQQTSYLNTNISKDAPPPYTGPNINTSAPYEHDL